VTTDPATDPILAPSGLYYPDCTTALTDTGLQLVHATPNKIVMKH